jgi:hypothetical protein
MATLLISLNRQRADARCGTRFRIVGAPLGKIADAVGTLAIEIYVNMMF